MESPEGALKLKNLYLFLAKLELHGIGTNDTVSLWINPNLSDGTNNLGTPTLISTQYDMEIDQITRIGLGLRRGDEPRTRFDALRISDTPEKAFHFVTTGEMLPVAPKGTLMVIR